MSLSWLLIGLFIGLAIWISQRKDVIRLSPERVMAGKRIVIFSAVLRWTLSGLFLAAAVQEGLGAGLSAFGGLMAARWVGIISLRVFPLQTKKV